MDGLDRRWTVQYLCGDTKENGLRAPAFPEIVATWSWREGTGLTKGFLRKKFIDATPSLGILRKCLPFLPRYSRKRISDPPNSP